MPEGGKKTEKCYYYLNNKKKYYIKIRNSRIYKVEFF